jgi:Domain of unknown function (DUF1707)
MPWHPGPGYRRTMNGVPTDHPAAQMRVSDADRDRAVSELSEHFQAGRLTSDEFDERSGLALRARTGSDLAGLFADLPRSQAPAAPTPEGPAAPVPRVSRPLVAAPVAIVLAVLVAGALSGHNSHVVGGLIPVLVVLLVILRVGRISRRRGGPREPQ